MNRTPRCPTVSPLAAMSTRSPLASSTANRNVNAPLNHRGPPVPIRVSSLTHRSGGDTPRRSSKSMDTITAGKVTRRSSKNAENMNVPSASIRRPSKPFDSLQRKAMSLKTVNNSSDFLNSKATAASNQNDNNKNNTKNNKPNVDDSLPDITPAKSLRKSKRYLKNLFKKNQFSLPPIQSSLKEENEENQHGCDENRTVTMSQNHVGQFTVPPPPQFQAPVLSQTTKTVYSEDQDRYVDQAQARLFSRDAPCQQAQDEHVGNYERDMDGERERYNAPTDNSNSTRRDTFTLEQPNTEVLALAQLANACKSLLDAEAELAVVEKITVPARISIETISRRWRIDLADASELMHNVESQNSNTVW